MTQNGFGGSGGEAKKDKWLFLPLEKKLLNACVPKVPLWLETYHLTLLTILWSGFIVLFSFFAKENIHWLWGVSLLIVFQFVTDLFDGAVGRYRKTGLVRWGYYMDHFLDYVFLYSLLIGYSFILSDEAQFHLFLLLAVSGGFMVHSFLVFGATNEFRQSYGKVGPTEIRILFILLNALIIFFGTAFFERALPFIVIFAFVTLCVIVYKSQKEIWRIDMEKKKE